MVVATNTNKKIIRKVKKEKENGSHRERFKGIEYPHQAE